MHYPFDDVAWAVFQRADELAAECEGAHTGTEHLLLALLDHELPGLPDPTRDRPRAEATALLPHGFREEGKKPDWTRYACLVRELAVEEARSGARSAAGARDLLLGLLREPQGTGGRLLREAGLTARAFRKGRRMSRATELGPAGEYAPAVSPGGRWRLRRSSQTGRWWSGTRGRGGC